ncbi:MAG: galactose mutarotase [Firmicutes bacterium]|nr:galactose mutarotase [Bacillota bacterium]
MIQLLEKRDNGIEIYSMKNDMAEVHIINFGATITKFFTKDAQGNFDDIVLGYDDLSLYDSLDACLGATIGRVANRIKLGQFTINGKEYNVPINNGPNSLHGGIKGFAYRMFDAKIVDENSLEMTYVAQDGEEGYPGKLTCKVTYTLSGNTFKTSYWATSDADTLCNLTNHSYFNLAGAKENVLNHTLQVHADQIACVDADGCTTGVFKNVKDTPFDFNEPKKIGDQIVLEDEQLTLGNGYDHPFIFNTDSKQVTISHENGRKLVVTTTYPLAQIYTANFLTDRPGKYGISYYERNSVCVECQFLPDSIHLEENSPTLLKAGEVYEQSVLYEF